MILVAGGTGRLGSLLVRSLLERKLEVRVLTRDPARARPLAALGADIMQGDIQHAADVARAVAGADTVVSAMHGFAGPGRVSPESIDRAGNIALINAAASAGASFVLMSVVGATSDSPMELFRAKYDAEEHLRRSGIPYTIVRATSFVETWAMVMLGTAGKESRTAMVFGRGENPINFVSVTDVAALLERAVVEPELRGQALEIGGENLTFNQFATALQVAAGRPLAVKHIPRAMLRVMGFIMRGPNPMFARQARAAVIMDTADMSFNATTAALRTETSVALKRYFVPEAVTSRSSP